MNIGVTNLLRWLDIPEEQVWAMATSNVVDLMGWKDRGIVREGVRSGPRSLVNSGRYLASRAHVGWRSMRI